MQSINEQLLDARRARHLSQKALGARIGLPQSHISEIETGKVERPHPATLRLLAAVLGQVPVVLYGSNGGPVFDPNRFENSRRDRMPYMCVPQALQA